MNKLLLTLIFVCFSCVVSAQERNLIVVTIDGLRWQEVFQGADQTLINNETYVKDIAATKSQFWRDSAIARRETLMPFFWSTIAQQGSVIGNRLNDSRMSVANPWYFSYPGYSEIFTGIVDESINSNKKIPNPQVTFLEWLNAKPAYEHKVAAFGSWDVFPYIFNTERSRLHVNAGFEQAQGYELSSNVAFLNQLQRETPSPWKNVRLDAFTYHFAKDYLLTVQPKLMAISLGETDDFAHDGHYDHYLSAATRTDHFLKDLWQTIQSTPHYKDKTNVLIITDHGRGSSASDWQHHASKASLQGYMKGLKRFPEGIIGSENIWFAAIGPDIKSVGEVKTVNEVKQQQLAATALTLLDEDPAAFNPNIAAPITEVLK